MIYAIFVRSRFTRFVTDFRPKSFRCSRALRALSVVESIVSVGGLADVRTYVLRTHGGGHRFKDKAGAIKQISFPLRTPFQ
jgi:hypothetical protein